MRPKGCDFETGCEGEILHVLTDPERVSVEVLDEKWNVTTLLKCVATTIFLSDFAHGGKYPHDVQLNDF